jgi:predicted AAA+ superfamily ATPase
MLEISEKDVLRSLQQDNPWWQTGQPPTDATFTHVRAYFPRFAEMVLNWNIRRTVILMGPRRVGKTVMLRQLIAKLIQSGFSPKCILFAPIDTPTYSGMALDRFIKMFEEHTGHASDARRIVIFDEIQYLKDWEVHLKVLTDRYPNTRLVASGSAAAALRLKSQESGAGRFTDFFLPPLTFAEFLDFIDQEKKLIKQQSTRRYATTNISELNKQFVNYLNYGGYPEAVLNESIQLDLRRFLGRDIVDKVLLRDLPSLYGIQDIQELNRLFASICYNSGQEVSLEALSSNSGVAKPTISRYLEYLEAAFLIVRVRRIDDTGRTFKRMRQFKVYLTNPSMRAALYAPLTDDDGAIGALVETAIFSQWFHSDQFHHIHYARWKTGRQDREVDLVSVNPASLKPAWAYEVKWSDRCVERPEELIGLVEIAKKNHPLPVGATTKTLTAETALDGVIIKHFPCALHCYQVGRNVTEGYPA